MVWGWLSTYSYQINTRIIYYSSDFLHWKEKKNLILVIDFILLLQYFTYTNFPSTTKQTWMIYCQRVTNALLPLNSESLFTLSCPFATLDAQ